ncbi:AbfB domain-containing protein [Streptomyces sp. NPDC088554]|uniref:AbfB domain-containing protein n=1 Tax=Streptomyces sp. NPDC088554 TaxID=3365865 RepID=UPI00381BB2CB
MQLPGAPKSLSPWGGNTGQGKEIARSGTPGPPPSADPSDVMLFADPPAATPPPGAPAGLGGIGGLSLGAPAPTSSYGTSYGTSYGSSYGDGHPPSDVPWNQAALDEQRPSRAGLVRNTVLLGVATLAFGVILALVAGPTQNNADRAAAPVIGSNGRGLPADPRNPDTAPGDLAEASGEDGQTYSDESGTTSGLQPDDAGGSALTGSSASKGKTADGTSGGKSDEKTGEKSDAKPDGEKGSGSKDDADSGDKGKGKDKDDSDSETRPGSGSGSGGGNTHTPPPATSRQRAVQSINYPDRYWNVRDGLGYLDRVNRGSALYTVIDGLADSDCYSFSLGNGRYLRHYNFRIRADSDNGSAIFEQDATFCPRENPYSGTVMLESKNFPGRYIRHRDYQLWVDPFKYSQEYLADSSFRLVSK